MDKTTRQTLQETPKRPLFLGIHRRVVDTKGRVAIPTKWRIPRGTEFVATMHRDAHMSIQRLEAWEADHPAHQTRTDDEMKSLRRELASVESVKTDSQGRISIPAWMQAKGMLVDAVTILGAGSTFEVWNTEALEERNKQ